MRLYTGLLCFVFVLQALGQDYGRRRLIPKKPKLPFQHKPFGGGGLANAAAMIVDGVAAASAAAQSAAQSANIAHNIARDTAHIATKSGVSVGRGVAGPMFPTDPFGDSFGHGMAKQSHRFHKKGGTFIPLHPKPKIPIHPKPKFPFIPPPMMPVHPKPFNDPFGMGIDQFEKQIVHTQIKTGGPVFPGHPKPPMHPKPKMPVLPKPFDGPFGPNIDPFEHQFGKQTVHSEMKNGGPMIFPGQPKPFTGAYGSPVDPFGHRIEKEMMHNRVKSGSVFPGHPKPPMPMKPKMPLHPKPKIPIHPKPFTGPFGADIDPFGHQIEKQFVHNQVKSGGRIFPRHHKPILPPMPKKPFNPNPNIPFHPKPQFPIHPKPQFPIHPKPQFPILPKPQFPIHPKPQFPIHPKPQIPIHPKPQFPIHPKPQFPIHPKPQFPIHPKPQFPIHPKPQFPIHPKPQFPIHPKPQFPIHPKPQFPIHPKPQFPIHPKPQFPIHPKPQFPIHPKPQFPIHPKPQFPIHPKPKIPIHPKPFPHKPLKPFGGGMAAALKHVGNMGRDAPWLRDIIGKDIDMGGGIMAGGHHDWPRHGGAGGGELFKDGVRDGWGGNVGVPMVESVRNWGGQWEGPVPLDYAGPGIVNDAASIIAEGVVATAAAAHSAGKSATVAHGIAKDTVHIATKSGVFVGGIGSAGVVGPVPIMDKGPFGGDPVMRLGRKIARKAMRKAARTVDFGTQGGVSGGDPVANQVARDMAQEALLIAAETVVMDPTIGMPKMPKFKPGKKYPRRRRFRPTRW